MAEVEAAATYTLTEVGVVEPRQQAQAPAMQPQSFLVYFDFDRSDIRTDGEATIAEVIAAAKLARADTFVDRLENGYETVLGERGSGLSQGQRQLLAIARVALMNPRILILDEATEGLAPIIKQEIWAAINKLKSEAGLSILVIDKSIKELRRVCDEAVILERGRTVWNGPMSALSSETTEQFLGV